jgi:hypothetical protein
MENSGVKLRDHGRPARIRQLGLATMTLALVATGTTQAAQRWSKKNPQHAQTNVGTAASAAVSAVHPQRAAPPGQKATLAGLSGRIPVGNAKSKPKRTPPPFG